MTQLTVLYEDNHIIAINKQCGDIVQGDKTGDKTLGDDVKDYLKERYNKPGNVFLGVTHRLDRPTSGAVLFARTSKALTRLNEMFKEDQSIHKTYWAVVDKKPEPLTCQLTHWLVRDTKKNKSFAYLNERKESKKASLTYRYLSSSDRFHLIEIELHTGRHHQIRAQLASLGCPILGDELYGSTEVYKPNAIALHAAKLVIQHPVTGEEMVFEAKSGFRAN